MVKKLQKDPSLLRLGGDTRTMTYLFSDIRGFTPISEQFKTDPQGLGKLINRYMTPMTDLVMRKEGTIDKYIGDALMAIWNAPLDVDNHAQLAIETAQEMEVELKNLNKELKADGLMELGVGIGINTGELLMPDGNIPYGKMPIRAILYLNHEYMYGTHQHKEEPGWADQDDPRWMVYSLCLQNIH